MASAGASLSSSPRLPSPPPFPEVQIGPKSPTISDGSSPSDELLTAPYDVAATRRIRPGTKGADMASGPPLVPLAQLDSPFQLQEHLKSLYHNFTRPSGSSTLAPITREVAARLAEAPDGVERSLWLYELCRFLTMKANSLIIAFFAENPPCSAQTCPEMRASEWQYLCAVHDPPKPCCAIDYCCHTLDWATNILTSPKYFPSRLTLGSDASGGAQASMKHLTNIFRRVYRIFAHAWFQHREVFWQVEGSDGLYALFKTVCDMYRLIPDDGYTIPPEAEGEEVSEKGQQESEKREPRRMMILRKDERTQPVTPSKEEADPASLNVATQRRHRYSPSRPSSVATITEAVEDDEDEKSISVDEPNLGSGSMEFTESPVEIETTAQAQGAESTIADNERMDMDKTPSNAEPQGGKDEQGPQETEEDIGSPGPEERHPESVVVIRPHPDAGRRKPHHADQAREEHIQHEGQPEQQPESGESSGEEQKEETASVQPAPETEQTQSQAEPQQERETEGKRKEVYEEQDKPQEQSHQEKLGPEQESEPQEDAKDTSAESEPAETNEKVEEQSTAAKDEKAEEKAGEKTDEKEEKP